MEWKIASPCPVSWEGMTGDDRVRYCGQCKRSVYNLTRLSRAETEHFILAREGDVCVRIYQRGDGSGLAQDCPEGRKRILIKTAFGLAAVLVVSVAVWLLLKDLDRTKLHLPDWLQSVLNWAPRKHPVTMGKPCLR
jgi:hypothetical protein